jgi:predicted Rossmann fold flavoprotein
MLKKVIVVGGGPAGMFAAWNLAQTCEVHLFEQSSSLGRKLLVAGKGGLNITNHSIQKAREVYIPSGFMNRALDVLDNEALRDWLHNIGIPTYVGSSGKVFPQKGIKAYEVVQKMTDALHERKVNLHLNHKLISFTAENEFTFEITQKGQAETQFSEPQQTKQFRADYCILALGGASWPQTGSDGEWVNMFRENGIQTLLFQPSNCGINIDWPDNIRQFHSGKPLKNVAISLITEGEETGHPSPVKVKMNEALITDDGLEGAAVYGIVPDLRGCISAGKNANISIDFKPQNTIEQLLKKLSAENINNSIEAQNSSDPKKESVKLSVKQSLKRSVKQSGYFVPDYKGLLSIQSEQMALIKAFTSREILHNKEQFCQAIKNLIIPVKSLRPIDEAISVIGGISIDDINDNFSLKSHPSIFVIGEMVNWDAPTGGFLLQGCFSMAALAARSILKG